MKKIKFLAIIAFLAVLPLASVAQSSAIDRYYDAYRGDDRFTVITVSGKMFSLFANFDMEDPAEQELVETISKLKGLKMMIGSELEDAKALYRNVAGKPEGKMEELMAITETEKEFKFYITESNGMISELLMIGYENGQVMMLSLVGEIDLKQIAALSKKMDLEGFEHFENVDKK